MSELDDVLRAATIAADGAFIDHRDGTNAARVRVAVVQQLRAIKSEHRYDRFDAIELADRLLAAGWRPTVALSEQVSGSRLRTCPAHPGHAPFLAAYGCPWCTITSLRAGRFTVTPEQLLAVVQILDDVPAVRFPETWMRKARDIARAFGLEVPSE
jgi:hypothetical protein